MKRGSTNHPKTVHLAEMIAAARGFPMEESRTLAVGCLVRLFHEAADAPVPDGGVGRFRDSFIESWMGWAGEVGALVGMLVEAGWLDRVDEPARLYVHDWHDHREDFVDMRLFRMGKPYANGVPATGGRLSKKDREAILERRSDPAGILPRVSVGSVRTDQAHGVRTDAGKCAHGIGETCARCALDPCALPGPVPGPEPEPIPEEEGGVRTACARESSSSSGGSGSVLGLEWDRESNTIRIDMGVVEDHPGDCVFRIFFSRWASGFVKFVEEVEDLEAWTITCRYWIFHGWNPEPIERMLDRYQDCLNGQRAKMIREMAKDEVVAPNVVLWDSTAAEAPGGSRRFSPEDAAAWGKLIKVLESEIDEESFRLWIRPTEVRWGEEDGVLEIMVPSDLARNWLASHYMDTWRTAVEGAFGRALELSFVVEVGMAGSNK